MQGTHRRCESEGNKTADETDRKTHERDEDESENKRITGDYVNKIGNPFNGAGYNSTNILHNLSHGHSGCFGLRNNFLSYGLNPYFILIRLLRSPTIHIQKATPTKYIAGSLMRKAGSSFKNHMEKALISSK